MKELFKSNNCLELLTKKFDLFNVKLSTNAVCSTTNDASVMEKIGNNSFAKYQLCFAHAYRCSIAVDLICKAR